MPDTPTRDVNASQSATPGLASDMRRRLAEAGLDGAELELPGRTGDVRPAGLE